MSNKTPKAIVKKTKWARSLLIVAVATLTLLIIVILYFGERALAPSGDTNVQTPGACDGLAAAVGKCYPLERADTNQTRMKGLSERDSLKSQNGMLFLFDSPTQQQCMWMKDMRFNLDIIWLNEEKSIIKIEQNVSPSTYPNSFCADNTKYVIELNSGEAQNLSLALGQQLTF